MQTAVSLVGLADSVYSLMSKIKDSSANAKKHPCPCCRAPKEHHSKCTTAGCRSFKEVLRRKYADIYGTMAFDAGSGSGYWKFRNCNESLKDALKRLPEERLKEYFEILQRVQKI